jgi:hypothetical protein
MNISDLKRTTEVPISQSRATGYLNYPAECWCTVPRFSFMTAETGILPGSISMLPVPTDSDLQCLHSYKVQSQTAELDYYVLSQNCGRGSEGKIEQRSK